MLRFHNTLSGQTEEFKPLTDNEVRLYCCGPTVWSYAHIGNFRSFVFADILRRHLKFKGYQVRHAMNLTDVDDRIINEAAKAGVGDTQVQTLHRIEESVVRADIEKAGFVLERSGGFLRNPHDTMDWNASPGAAAEKRGTSDRFVLLFKKPG